MDVGPDGSTRISRAVHTDMPTRHFFANHGCSATLVGTERYATVCHCAHPSSPSPRSVVTAKPHARTARPANYVCPTLPAGKLACFRPPPICLNHSTANDLSKTVKRQLRPRKCRDREFTSAMNSKCTLPTPLPCGDPSCFLFVAKQSDHHYCTPQRALALPAKGCLHVPTKHRTYCTEPVY